MYGQQFLPEKSNLTSFYTHNLTTTELCIFVRDLSHEKNSFATTERKKSAIKGRENNTEAFLEVKNCCWPLLQTQCAVSASILVRVLFLFYIPKIHIFYNFVPKRKKRDRLIYTLFCETLVEEKWAKTKVGKPKKWFLMILWCAHTRYFNIMRSCLYSNIFVGICDAFCRGLRTRQHL